MTRPTRRLGPLLAAGVLVLLIATGCSSSGFPGGYGDQVDEETGLSNVEMNWLEGCQVGFSEELAQDANAVCACSYSRITNQIPFEDFVAVNDRLKSDPESLTSRAADNSSTEAAIVDIVSTCIDEG